jgi:hypothetical protein
MTYDSTAGWWRGNETWLVLFANGGHPGNVSDAIRRWVAPQAGSVRITGNAQDTDTACGGGVSVSIAKNATVLWQQTLANGNTAGIGFDLTTTVLQGDSVNFSINRGPDGNNSCDMTGFDPTIVFTPGGAPVPVPNVVNLTQAAATTALGNAGLTLGPVSNAASTTVPAGSVISQNPGAGTLVAPGSAVALVVSSGPPAVTLASLTLQPTSVKGGNQSTGTVTLSAPAPTGGLTVTLSSSDSGIAQVPSSITVPAGATSAQFTVSTSRPRSSTEVTISANLASFTKAATLTVRR